MSGEITVTQGKTWTNETVDKDKLNLTAQPTARVDEDAITSREIDGTEFLSAYSESFRERNYCYNPVLWDRYWEDTSAGGKSCPAGEYTENAQGWFVKPTGAAVSYRQSETGPNTSVENRFAAQIVGATSVTTVEFGQYFTGDVAKQLSTDIALQCQCYATSGTITNLTAELHVCGTENDFSTLSSSLVLTKGTSGTQPDGWTIMQWTADLSGVANLERGCAVVFKVASGDLDSNTKEVRFTQMQLETALTRSEFINPVNPDQRKQHNLHAQAAPTITDDLTKGYRPGSLWLDETGAADPDIYLASATDEGAAAWSLLNKGTFHMVNVYDAKADGTEGGGYTSGSAVKRDLTNMTPTGIGYPGWSLTSSQMTMPAGTYFVTGSVPAYRTNESAAWLYDTTGSAVLVNGSQCDANSSGGSGAFSFINGRFTLSVESVLELRFQGTTTRATDGLGHAAGLSRGGEVYSQLQFIKMPD